MATTSHLTSVECPRNPGIECPYLVSMVGFYEHPRVNPEDNIEVAIARESDDRLLNLRIIEHLGAANLFDCERPGLVGPECPVATRMSESISRKAARGIIKRLLGIGRKG